MKQTVVYIVLHRCLGFCFVFGINLIWSTLELVNISWRDGLLVVFHFSNICMKPTAVKQHHFFSYRFQNPCYNTSKLPIIIVRENVSRPKPPVIEITVTTGRFDSYTIVIMSRCWSLFSFIINRSNND